MDNGLIPHRYAKALHKYALERGVADKVYDTAKAVARAFADNEGLQKVMANPFVKKEDKSRLLLSAAGEGAGEAYDRFVKLVTDHKREEFFRLMMLAYIDIYRKANRILQARIATAAKLQPEEMRKLRRVVEDGFKGSEIEFVETVDPDLIGGFVIDVDGVRMDASVSHELEQLRQTLLRSK